MDNNDLSRLKIPQVRNVPLTNAERQRRYRERRNPPTPKALLVTRFKTLAGRIPFERLDTMLTKWEGELRSRVDRQPR